MKTTMRYHFTLARMVIIKNNGNHQKYSKLKNASVDVRKEKPSVGEIIN